jgi:predicted extracellular nuclease
MRLSWSFLLLCAACGAATSSEPMQEDPSEALVQEGKGLQPMDGRAIVCYNVENLFDTQDDPAIDDSDFLPSGALAWDNERYRTKLEQLSEAIHWSAAGEPALIGLVEVENRRVVEELAATGGLKKANYAVVHHDSPDERGIDVALLVHPEFAEVAAEEPLAVPLGDDRTRDVLYVHLRLARKAELHVFVNHWPSRRDGDASVPKRLAAAKVVRDRVNAVLKEDPQARILIMGDLNDTPTDLSIQQGLGAACDAAAQTALYDLMCMGQPEGHGSYNYQGEWSYLDQFIVSAAMLPLVDDAKAFWDDRLLFRHPRYGKAPDKTYAGRDYKGGYSDHLPIVLRLK